MSFLGEKPFIAGCIGAVLFVLYSQANAAGKLASKSGELSERVRQADLRPEMLFPQNRTPLEEEDYQEGRRRFQARYGKGEFKGYVLFQDPYDANDNRISFLLGTDCSHFVYRLYQLLGADYPFAKTRHFIHLAKARAHGLSASAYHEERESLGRPLTLSRKEFVKLARSFRPLERAELGPGDLIVIGKKEGPYGTHGHVVMVVSEPDERLRVLHAKDAEAGIVEEEFDLSPWNEVYYFGFRGEMLAETVLPPH